MTDVDLPYLNKVLSSGTDTMKRADRALTEYREENAQLRKSLNAAEKSLDTARKELLAGWKDFRDGLVQR